jgi:hypothetical protein
MITKIFIIIGTCLVIFIIAGVVFMIFSPEFGGSPNKKQLSQIQSSSNYQGGIFVNKQLTSISTRSKDSP